MHAYRNQYHRQRQWCGLVVIGLLATVLFTGCGSGPMPQQIPETEGYYTCSMHPQIHSNKPGVCPVCGMKLRFAGSGSASAEPLDSALRYLTRPVTATVIGNFKVIAPVKGMAGDTIRAEGYIGFDQRDVRAVSTKVAGRIEKVRIQYTNQTIRKGQALMDIYSPQLLRAQRDLLQACQDEDVSLSGLLKERLRNLGMGPAAIQAVIQRKQPLARTTIYSPYNGISRKTNPVSGVATGAELLDVRAGMYVRKGQTVFSIQGIHRARAILNVFTREVWCLQEGDRVHLYAGDKPMASVDGRIGFIPPGRSGQEKTSRVIVYLDPMPPDWKIGTLLHGQIIVNDSDSGLFIPLAAVNRLGRRNVVWVQDKTHPEVFQVRTVRLGLQRGAAVEILSGIHIGDKIAANAAYMVDHDSFVD